MTDNIITLVGPNDEEVEFQEIAGISLGSSFYLILEPLKKIQGLEEGEVYVFEVEEHEDSEPDFYPVNDEEILNAIFDEYEKLLEEENK